jgi:endo-1,4-beta-D-glucanase Y
MIFTCFWIILTREKNAEVYSSIWKTLQDVYINQKGKIIKETNTTQITDTPASLAMFRSLNWWSPNVL